MMHKMVDQDMLNAILNAPNTATASDSWKGIPDASIMKMMKYLGPPPKNLLIKIHPTVFDKIGNEFGPFTRDPVSPEMYSSKDPFTTFYVTKKASLTEIEIMELPAPKLFRGSYQ